MLALTLPGPPMIWLMLQLLILLAGSFVLLKLVRDRIYPGQKSYLTIVEIIVMIGLSLLLTLLVSQFIIRPLFR